METSGCNSQVFTVNHVLEIMLHYAESKDWKEAFHKVVPERKRAPDGEDGPEAKKQRKDAE